MVGQRKYLIDFPELMKDWMPEKNIGLDPAVITAGSHKKVLWHCHKCEREWVATVHNRVNGSGCTCDAKERAIAKLRARLVERDGSLAKTRPEIAKQWHPTLNGKLTPNDITEKSMYKAWWIGDDGIVWQSMVCVRCRTKEGTKRPKSLVVKGVNDLQTLRPDLAEQWDYEKNIGIDINDVMPGSKNKVWWICEKGHEWQASISSRHYGGNNCPTCNKERSTSFPEQAIYYYIKKCFSDAQSRYYPEKNLELDVYIPSSNIAIEYDGVYYHSSKRKKEIDERKNRRLNELGIVLIRIIETGGKVPRNTAHYILCERKDGVVLIEEAIIKLIKIIEKLSRKTLNIHVDIEHDRAEIYSQYILAEKENSLSVVAPNAIAEWHPTKNGRIKPELIHAMSNKKFWWKCIKCGYEWQAPAYRRAKGNGCPACTGNILAEGINDLATTFPEVALEWNYEKNCGVIPQNVISGSNKKYWWICSKCGYEWMCTPSNRIRSTGCPRCAGKIVTQETSLKALYPKIAKEWNYKKNGELTPEKVFPHSDKQVWWICAKSHEWKSSIGSRTKGNGCPYCGNKIVLPGFNDFASNHPELLDEWDEDNEIAPTQVLSGSDKKFKWVCKNGHKWEAKISNRIRGNGCPYCANRITKHGENDLQFLYPELAAEWDFEKNSPIMPTDVTPGSNKKVWWKCKKCQGSWQAIIWSRVKGRGCPYCAGKKVIVGKNDLKTKNPKLSAEWNYEKNGFLIPERYMPNSRSVVWWKCKECGFEWKAEIGARNNGRIKCPKCKGKYKPIKLINNI